MTPWDTQTGRIWSDSEAYPTFNKSATSGQNRQAVLTFAYGMNREIISEGGTAQGPVESYELCPTLDTHSKPHGVAVMCLQDGQANGGICDDHAPTLNAMHEQPIVIDRAAYNQGENAAYPPPHRADGSDGPAGCEGSPRCSASNGEDVVSALCARDWKGVGSQYVTDGKVVCQPTS